MTDAKGINQKIVSIFNSILISNYYLIIYISIVINSLFEFARMKTPLKQKTEVNEFISKTLSEIGIPKSIEVIFQLDDLIPVIMVDPIQISVACQNIVRNAVQAMKGGGQLIIKSLVVD